MPRAFHVFLSLRLAIELIRYSWRREQDLGVLQ